MVSYFLFTPDLSHVSNGSHDDCLARGYHFAKSEAFPLLKIARARMGEPDATIIYDITEGSHKQSSRARRVSCSKLVQGSKQRPFPL